MPRPAPPFTPRQVLLFSGHRVDAPGRAVPRLPPALLADASVRIEQALDAAGAGPGDAALCQAASGGDLLFSQACHTRGVRVQWLLPLPESEFIEQSLLTSMAGAAWRERYFGLKSQLADAPRVMADELGPLPTGANAFERCNQWLLDTALAQGSERLRFICLWDGGGGDGPGGTRHMVEAVRRCGAPVDWIDTRTLVAYNSAAT